MTTFTAANGDKFLMVEIPLNPTKKDWILIPYGNYGRLGSYYRDDRRIDFDVKEEWVKSYDLSDMGSQHGYSYGIVYNNYLGNMPDSYKTATKSFISLIESEIAKSNINAERILIIKIL